MVIEEDYHKIDSHPENVRSYYQAQGYAPAILDFMEDTYQADGNFLITNKDYCREKALFYRLKLPIPIGLIVFPFS